VASIGAKSADQDASLQLRNLKSHRQWPIGSYGRNLVVFWSPDTRWLLLIDDYAADDAKIRIFDLQSSGPKEVRGLDRSLKSHVFRHIPRGKSALWFHYSQVCFTSENPSRVLLTAEAPFAPDAGGSGTGMNVQLAVDFGTMKVSEISVHVD